MNILWWIITALLMLGGLAGTVLPLLPGSLLIFGGALFHRLAFGAGHSVGWGTITALGALMIASHALDFLSGSLGAKYFGATRYGAIGGLVGGIVGIFFGILGIIVGPLIGVMVGELAGGRALAPATRSTWGTFLGTTAGMLAKIGIAMIMIVWFIVALAL